MGKYYLVGAFMLALVTANVPGAAATIGIIPAIAFIALIALLVKIKKEKEMSYGYGGGGYGGGGGGYGGGGGGGYGGGGGGGYYKRSIEDNSPTLPLPQNVTTKQLEKAFSTIYKYDENFCVPRLICEIHAAADRSQYGELEKGILKVFEVYHPKKPGSPGYIYRQAADFGISSSSDAACWNLYSSCDMSPPQLTNLVKFLE